MGCQVDNVNTMVIGAVVVSLVASLTRGLSIGVHLISPLQHNFNLEQKNIATYNLQSYVGQPLGTEHHRKQILIRVALSSVLVHFVVECFRLLAQCQRVGNTRPFLSWLLLLLLISPTSSCTSVRALDLTLPMTTKAHLDGIDDSSSPSSKPFSRLPTHFSHQVLPSTRYVLETLLCLLVGLWYSYCLLHGQRCNCPFPCLVVADLRAFLVSLRLSVQLLCHSVLDIVVVGKLTLVPISTSALAEHPANLLPINCPSSLIFLGHGHVLL